MNKHEAIYPGHPTTIAYFIVNHFDSFAAATKKGHSYPKALESVAIPGAGGNVAAALEVLSLLVKGCDKGLAFARADSVWNESCYTKDRLEPGQTQADELKPLLVEKLKTWGMPDEN